MFFYDFTYELYVLYYKNILYITENITKEYW